MRKFLIISVAAVLIGGSAYAAANDPGKGRERSRRRSPRKPLEIAAGKPISCINARDLGSNRSLGEYSILFENKYSSRTFWINHPRGGCPDLTSERALRWKSTMSQMCSGDIVDVFDPTTRIPYGSCSLGDFTPYSKPKAS